MSSKTTLTHQTHSAAKTRLLLPPKLTYVSILPWLLRAAFPYDSQGIEIVSVILLLNHTARLLLLRQVSPLAIASAQSKLVYKAVREVLLLLFSNTEEQQHASSAR